MAGMLVGPAVHRAIWAHARDQPSDASREDAPTDETLADEFPHLAAVGPLMDWSASAEADRVTIELLIGGLEALAGQQDRGRVRQGTERRGQTPRSTSA